MPLTFHELIIVHDSDAVGQFIQEGRADVHALDERGYPPLGWAYRVLGDLSLADYHIIILLLKAGANPLQIRPYYDALKIKDLSPFILALVQRDLVLVRLFLWHLPKGCDYKTLKIESINGHCRSAGEEAFIRDAFEVRKGLGRAYAKWVNETAAEVEKVWGLQTEIEGHTATGDAKSIAECNLKIGKIYFEQAKLELTPPGDPTKSLIYPDKPPYYDSTSNFAEPKDYRPVFAAHYQSEGRIYLQKAYDYYRVAEDALPKKPAESVYADQTSIDAHTAVLNKLIDLTKRLALEAEKRIYLRKIAQVTIKVPGVPLVSAAASVHPVREVSVTADPENNSDDTEALLPFRRAPRPSILPAWMSFGMRQRRRPTIVASSAELSAEPSQTNMSRL